MTTNDAAPAPDTVEQIMALAWDYKDAEYDDPLHTYAALRAAVEKFRDDAVATCLLNKKLAERAVKERDGWQEEARRYCGNADYWRGRAERAEREAADLRARLAECEALMPELEALEQDAACWRELQRRLARPRSE